MVLALSLLVFAYLLGSVPTGILVSRGLGKIDITKVGSGNIGATNVARVLGKGMGALTLLGDVAKGWLPVFLGQKLLGQEAAWIAGVALATFIGHLYPVFLKFKGGKGVAVGLGVFLAISPLAGLIVFLIWAGVVVGTRIVSVGSLTAALALPVVVGLVRGSLPYLSLAILVCILIFYRHRENIRRLLAGSEKGFSHSSD